MLLSLLVCTGLFAETGARYLVITPDYFFNTLQPLIEWKYRSGQKAAVYKTSQIGSDTASIKNFIENCYNTWDIKPEFVVLVGHPGYIPMRYYYYGGYGYYTDNYYANMDGDFYTELTPGRLSVADNTQLQTVINKIFAYERNPYMQDSLWFRRGVAIANCDGSSDYYYLTCMRYTESVAVANGYESVDTLCDNYGHNWTHVVNAINQGRGFVLYRGNANNAWYMPFNFSPSSTANGNKLPIIISTTCRTISPTSTPLFGEQFLRVGTPFDLRGAVGFIGGTRNTSGAAHLRNAVAYGCIDAMFLHDKRTLGEIAEGGRLRVYQDYSELREYNNFTCLGDPALRVWTATPCSIAVQHPEFVSFGAANFTVNVRDHTGLPVLGAYVCISAKADSGVYAYDSTNANGDVLFTVAPQIVDDSIYVTVTGKNLRPYEGSMVVRILDYCYIIYLRSIIDDSLGGNNDGIINPAETIEMPLWVENIGESTGVGISGTLRCSDAFVTITDSVKNFGDINGHDSSFTGEDGFNYIIADTCPNLYNVNFELIFSDTFDSTWVSYLTKIVYAAELTYSGYSIGGGNGNNVVEPGETVEVYINLKNNGGASSDSIQALLHCQDSMVVFLDSVGMYDPIPADSAGINDSTPFVIAVDSVVPIGTAVPFTMTIEAGYLVDTFNFQIIVGQKNYYLWNPDPTPQPGQNIHSILTNRGYCGDYGTTLPAELAMYQVLFVCLGVYNNRCLLQVNDPRALQIIDFLNGGGRVYMEGSAVWYIDPYYFNGHDFRPTFNLSATTWSNNDMGPIAGQSGTFTQGMYFNYGGENSYMDHLSPVTNGFTILRDNNNSYICGVASDPGTYRTVGASFELGLLTDGTPPSTRSALLDSIMRFFGIPVPGVTENFHNGVSQRQVGLGPLWPNPFNKSIHIQYTINNYHEDLNTTLSIYDVSGRLIRQWDRATLLNDKFMVWSGDDVSGRQVPAGVYFVKLQHNKNTHVEKIILIH